MHSQVCVQVKGQCAGVSSLFLPCECSSIREQYDFSDLPEEAKLF